ncbi:MAG: DUF362 domain-containing protein [Clostridiales Family XIII bacterium]|jgi:uncharacterized protein (DUF362 family)|nr:DUF362 domain-containing protein [Clostridiales Family XIII bacterium]
MSKVSVAKCTDVWSYESIFRATLDVLAPLGGMKAFVKPGMSVMLKPNLVMPAKKEEGCTTHPLLIKALAVLAMEAGAGKVSICDCAGVGFSNEETFEATGMNDVGRELGIEVFPPNRRTDVLPLENHPNLREVKVGRDAMEYDVLINVPVMKTHLHTTITLCLKNLKGCLARSSMKALHVGGVDYGLAPLAEMIKPELNIIDGTIGSEGMGPMTGGPKEANCLIASADAFACDIVGCKVMGVNPRSIRHLTWGAEKYGYSLDFKDYELVGVPIEDAVCPFEMPPSRLDDRYGVHVVEKDACTGCNAVVATLLFRLDKLGELDLLDDWTIVVGQRAEVPGEGEECKSKKLLVGKCMEDRKDEADLFIPGCPPQAWFVMGLLYRLNGRVENDEFARQRMEIYMTESADGDYAKYLKIKGVQ